MHGNDERVPIASFEQGSEVIGRIVRTAHHRRLSALIGG